ncbi:hypothetical protein [Mycetocola spongiae]|uniref:hypothetical protein n=1 Tax=Mycetocola spongiae TaxID=2859226 RepID=UPI001CF504B7|nr:hypothetical protein [Mycetocola spongiae]UCR87885.1 hypothetical protein KXZ72_07580 [Mycetocola spongiae]
MKVMIRPRRVLFWRGVLAYVMIAAPIFVVLYWITVPRGTWGWVLLAHLILLAIAVFSGWRFSRTRMWATSEGLTERAFFGRIHFTPLSEINRCIILQLRRSAVDPTPQLFIVADQDRVVGRLRGEYWAAEDIEKLATALGAPIRRLERPISLDELQRNHAGMLYWFERSPFRQA